MHVITTILWPVAQASLLRFILAGVMAGVALYAPATLPLHATAMHAVPQLYMQPAQHVCIAQGCAPSRSPSIWYWE